MEQRRIDHLGETAPRTDHAIQVVSRVFDILRCFDSYNTQLGNKEVADRCKLPRSTVSRLTQTLTNLGQLVYSSQEQKYRLGPSAIAMSTTMLQGIHIRSVVRAKLEEMAERIPGTLGLLVPDKFEMVYLECARTENAVGLGYAIGSRVPIARTAAGLAYASAINRTDCDALLRKMERESPNDARALRLLIEPSREFLKKNGYVTAKGLFNEHITGCSVPVWSEQYQTFLVMSIGVLSTMYGQRRLHKELAPELLNVALEIGRMFRQ